MELPIAQGCRRAPARPGNAAHGRHRHTPRTAARPAQPRARRTCAPPAGAVADEAQPDSRQQPPEALHAAASPDSSALGVFGPSALAATAHSAPAFARMLRPLVQRGSGATEAHLVAAWAAQRRSPALRLAQQAREGGGDAVEDDRQALEALVLLEELTRQQLLALAPDQLGFVARCYVLAGGASKPLLLAIQHAACGWGPEDYSAAGLAELAWALAACGQALTEPCRQLLRSALGGTVGRGSEQAQAEQQGQPEQDMSEGGERQAAAAPEGGVYPQQAQREQQPEPQQQDRQQQRPQQARDWAAWLKGTPASRVVLLLWAAAQLDCRPCSACLAATVATLARDASLAKLPTKSLVTLLWSLATLRAAQQRRAPSRLQPLLHAVSGLLAHRMEDVLGSRPSTSSAASMEQKTVDEQTDGVTASGWYSGPTSSSSSSSSSSAASETELAALPTDMLCTVVWACGQLRHADTRLLQAATFLLHGRVDDMAPADMTRALWGLGQLGFCPAPLLTSLSLRLQQPGALAPLDPRQLAMVSYAFAALDFFPGQDAVDALADAALAARTRFQPRELAHVLWNMSRLGYVDDPFYLAFVPVILTRIEECGPAELADIARVYSRCGLNPTAEAGEAAAASLDLASSSDEATEGAAGSCQPDAAVGGTDEEIGSSSATLFDALARQTVARIQGADLQDVLRILTAFHQMGLQPDDLLDAVETWANQRLRKLSPQALALALWSFARMGSGSPGLLETAAACAEQLLEAFTPPQLAKVAWSFAKLDWPAPRVLRHAGSQLAARTSAFSDKEASNVLWALASQEVDVPAPELDAIAANLQPRLKSFGPQSLANIAWAYATLGHCPPPPFLQSLGTAALPQLPAFEPQGLSLLVWSLASLGCRHIKLFHEIVLLCLQRPSLLRQFEGQHLANLLWGLTRSGFRPLPAFLDQLAREGELRVRDFKPQELMNTAWAFTQLGHHPDRLFEAVAREAALQAFAFSPQELSATLWALAKARHVGPAMPPLLHAVERELAARGAAFEPRDLAILTWSCGQLGHLPAPEAAQLLWALLEAEVGGMPGRTLVTLAAGLAALEEQQQWRQQQQQQQQPQQPQPQQQEQQQQEQQEQPQAAAAPGSQPMVPPQLMQAVGERAVAVFAQLQPFEAAQLVLSLSVVGSQQAAEQLLLSPSKRAAQQLVAAAERAPLPDAVGLLWSMARWACYPAEPFAALCARLRQTSKHYRLPQAALARLGSAWQAMTEEQQQALRLRGGLRVAAYAAARHVALHGPPSSPEASSSGEGAAPQPGHWLQQRGGSEQRGSSQADSPGPAAPQPSFDLDNEEDPTWLEMTFEDLAQMAG